MSLRFGVLADDNIIRYIQYNNADEGYPVGGMSEFCRREITASKSNGAKFFWNQPVTKISHSTGTGYNYVVQTGKRTFLANDLILNIGPFDLANIGGDIPPAILAQPQATTPKSIQTYTVSIQWDPTAPRWWDYILKRYWGSYRRIESASCANRLEIQKTPYHMAHHAIRGVYSDSLCLPMWQNLHNLGQSFVRTEAMRLLHEIFDPVLQQLNLTIPEPVLVIGHPENDAWWYMKPFSNISWPALSQWANAPLGNSERICFAHSSHQIYYSGWSASAINRSDECLKRLYPSHFPQSLIDTWKTCGHFIDDNTVGPFYSTPGLSTQTDYTNRLSNEFVPPYLVGELPVYSVNGGPTVQSLGVHSASAVDSRINRH